MAIHNKHEDAIKESVQEMLLAAKLCLEYRKENGGCLGYPALALLLMVTDAIGSYYEGNKDYIIEIDKNPKYIKNNNFEHFFILNSEYYGLFLNEISIKEIYKSFRNLLIHNATIEKNYIISYNDPLNRPFCFSDGFVNSISKERYTSVALLPFFNITCYAVDKFIKNIDVVYPQSKQARLQNKR